MQRKILVLLTTTAVLAIGAFGQDTPVQARFQERSSIEVTLDGLTCNNSQGTIPALSWSFGVTTPGGTTTGGGVSAGKPNLTALSVNRRADSCTPVLFGAAVIGKDFKQVTIVEQDKQKDDTFTVTLTDAVIASYQLGGEESQEVPSEQIGFTFRKICVADTGTGSKSCWDLTKGTTF